MRALKTSHRKESTRTQSIHTCTMTLWLCACNSRTLPSVSREQEMQSIVVHVNGTFQIAINHASNRCGAICHTQREQIRTIPSFEKNYESACHQGSIAAPTGVPPRRGFQPAFASASSFHTYEIIPKLSVWSMRGIQYLSTPSSRMNAPRLPDICENITGVERIFRRRKSRVDPIVAQTDKFTVCWATKLYFL